MIQPGPTVLSLLLSVAYLTVFSQILNPGLPLFYQLGATGAAYIYSTRNENYVFGSGLEHIN